MAGRVRKSSACGIRMTNSGSREAMQAIGHDAGTDDDYCAPEGKAELDRVDAVKLMR